MPCPRADLGGWIIEHEQVYGVGHYCTEEAEQFVLQIVVKRRPDGGVAEWARLATLRVDLRRDESTMFGFECGSQQGKRGDAIAVVRYQSDGSFDVRRAWIIDAQNQRFVAVPPESIRCESLE
jgi:hypothetical protein